MSQDFITVMKTMVSAIGTIVMSIQSKQSPLRPATKLPPSSESTRTQDDIQQEASKDADGMSQRMLLLLSKRRPLPTKILTKQGSIIPVLAQRKRFVVPNLVERQLLSRWPGTDTAKAVEETTKLIHRCDCCCQQCYQFGIRHSRRRGR